VRETALQTPGLVQERRRWSRCQRRGSPAARGADHGEAGCAPAAHGGPQGSRDPPAARGGPHARAWGCPEEAVTLWSWFAGRTYGPVGTHAVPEGLHPMERTHGKDPHWSSS